ncbi:MAG: NUDIX hydrolase [Candidatus Merdivicinus sp.]
MESPARLGIGGIVIPGKGLQEALKRETLEESGILVKIVDFIGVQKYSK